MRALRRHRFATVLVALASLLFMQFALAGYVCPRVDNTAEMAAMAESGMPCAGDMAVTDNEQPALCHAHSQAAQTGLDKVQVPAAAAVAVSGFAYTLDTPRLNLSPTPAQAPLLLRSTPPPIAVRNCCFRI